MPRNAFRPPDSPAYLKLEGALLLLLQLRYVVLVLVQQMLHFLLVHFYLHLVALLVVLRRCAHLGRQLSLDASQLNA